MRGILVSLPIWGRPYVELWDQYALPAFLAPGNLPAINRIAPVTILIFTDLESYQQIQDLAAFHYMKGVVDGRVELKVIGGNPRELMDILHPGHRHAGTCFKNCHNMALEEAWSQDHAYICLSADTVWSNSGGEVITKTISAGKRALMYPGYGIAGPECEEFLRQIEGWRAHYRAPIDCLDVPPLQMCKKFLLASKQGFTPPSITEPLSSANPGRWQWSTGDGRGILVRPHHVNVGFIYPEKGPVRVDHGTDHELAQRALSSWDDVYVIYDMTEHLVASIDLLGTSAPQFSGGHVPQFPPYSRENAAVYLKVATSDWHRHWMMQHWWVHDGTLTPDDPARLRTEAESDAELAEIVKTYGRIMSGGMTAEIAELERKMRYWDY